MDRDSMIELEHAIPGGAERIHCESLNSLFQKSNYPVPSWD